MAKKTRKARAKRAPGKAKKPTPKPERKAPAGTITGVPCLKTDWRTPERLLDALRAYWGGRIPLDVATHASNPTNAVRYCALDDGRGWKLTAGGGEWVSQNGLSYPWATTGGGKAFCNPPYGKVIRDWLAKMAHEANRGCEIIALLPCARWEQAYFTEALDHANALCLIRKRVAFVNPATGDAVGGNPYANMFVGFNVVPWRWRRAFDPLGHCYELRAL